MTTIVAVARDGRVHMAADTLTNVYERPIFGGATKIQRVKVGGGQTALLGASGDGALSALVADRLTIDAAPDPAEATQPELDAWARAVAVAITELAIEAGVTDDGHLDGNLVLGYAGHVWTLCHQQAIPHPDGVAALGSGEGPAIGAVDALLAHGVDPDEAVREAVRIGIARDKHSGAPITCLTLH